MKKKDLKIQLKLKNGTRWWCRARLGVAEHYDL
jgi:hypothetical protein